MRNIFYERWEKSGKKDKIWEKNYKRWEKVKINDKILEKEWKKDKICEKSENKMTKYEKRVGKEDMWKSEREKKWQKLKK